MGLSWASVNGLQPDHYRADTEHGVYFIDPRKSDGAWEYRTPSEDWGEHDGHSLRNLTRDQAFAAVEAEFVSRGSK